MSIGRRSDKKTFSPTWKQYASGVDCDLVVDSPDGKTCAYMVVPLATGTFDKLIDNEGNNRSISVALPAGYKHVGDIAVANCSAAFLAYW